MSWMGWGLNRPRISYTGEEVCAEEIGCKGMAIFRGGLEKDSRHGTDAEARWTITTYRNSPAT